MAGQSAPRLVYASLEFIKDLELYKYKKPYMIADVHYVPVNKRSNIELEWRQVAIEDVRGKEANFTIEQHSFEFARHEHEIPSDKVSLESYAVATSAIIKDRFMADQVICYDSLRRENKSPGHQRHGHTYPVTVAHLDNTKADGLNKVIPQLSEEEADAPSAPLTPESVWRPLVDVVQDQPLAVCDRRTVHQDDILAVDRVTLTHQSEVAYLKHNEKHRWYYLSFQTGNEAVIFLTFDSEADGDLDGDLQCKILANGRFNCTDTNEAVCPHASFSEPSAPGSAEPRRSLELRIVVFNKL